MHVMFSDLNWET